MSHLDWRVYELFIRSLAGRDARAHNRADVGGATVGLLTDDTGGTNIIGQEAATAFVFAARIFLNAANRFIGTVR